MIKEGTKAPNFTLNDKDGNAVSLSDFIGKKVVLYFYPKDNTPGCSRQACAFAAAYEGFKKENIVVIGVSKDSIASHVKFAEKYSLPFILLSDPEKLAIEAYGVWQEKKMCGKLSMGVVRTTFIIDENGVVISCSELGKIGGSFLAPICVSVFDYLRYSTNENGGLSASRTRNDKQGTFGCKDSIALAVIEI